MAEHAKAQGFGGIVLMIDEFLLWLAEKSGQEFVAEINNLNVIVDHNTGQRQLPIFVFVARQRNLQEFFPDLGRRKQDPRAPRPSRQTLRGYQNFRTLNCATSFGGRVLRPKNASAVQQAVSSLAERHQKVLPALLAGGDIDYLRECLPVPPGTHRDVGGRDIADAARTLCSALAVRIVGSALSEAAPWRVSAGRLGICRNFPRIRCRGEQEGRADAGYPPSVLLAPCASNAEDGGEIWLRVQ